MSDTNTPDKKKAGRIAWLQGNVITFSKPTYQSAFFAEEKVIVFTPTELNQFIAQELLAEVLDMIPEKHHIAPNLDSHAAMVTYLKNEGRNETIDEMIKAAEERFKL